VDKDLSLDWIHAMKSAETVALTSNTTAFSTTTHLLALMTMEKCVMMATTGMEMAVMQIAS
jgi:hypothetical protein